MKIFATCKYLARTLHQREGEVSDGEGQLPLIILLFI
jgi:hypothetical protein